MLRIGVDLGGTKIEAAVFDPANGERARRRVSTPRDDYEGTVQAIAGLVLTLEGEAGAACRVGVGTPGAVSPATGRIKNANSTWLNGKPLREDLEARLARPVRLANDANCFALSEAVDGGAAGAAVVFGVILGTGVGGGVVVGGRPLLGANAVAGEWGHNPLPWPADDERPGPACYCGRRGCVETFLSGPGLASDHAAHAGLRLPPEAIAEAAARGEPAARATLDRYVDRAARGLASVINVLDPDVIVLGGGLSAVPLLYVEIPARWGGYVFSDRVDTRLVPPRHGDAGGVRGAAWLWAPGE